MGTLPEEGSPSLPRCWFSVQSFPHRIASPPAFRVVETE
jgi:hypothetical protein